MNDSDLIALLRQELLSEGIRSKTIPMSRFEEVKAEVTKSMNGMTDSGLIKYINACFDFATEKAIQNPRSILIMGVSSPKIRFRLTHEGQEVDAIVPPTYLDHADAKARIESVFKRILGEHDRRYVSLQIPVKLLAVRSGLAEYGRNNIAYVGDMGSHVRLMVFASDLVCGDHEWHEKRAMARCERCEICSRNCPTGAIDKSRFLLRAERCLTFLNEEETAIPEWVDTSWHHCLVGCLRCQDICPANNRVSKQCVEGPIFSEGETEMMMKSSRPEDLQADLRKKLEDSGLSSLYPVLPRNISLLLDKDKRGVA